MLRTTTLTLLLWTVVAALPARATDTDGDTLTDADETAIYLTDPTNPDTDGDGLRDDWEILGVPYTDAFGRPARYRLDWSGGPGAPNPGRGARRKTLYLEIDAMNLGVNPDVWTVVRASAAVSNAFRGAPVANPDGSTGIEVIVWNDELFLPAAPWTFNPGAGVSWPPEFAGFKQSKFGSVRERSDPSWNQPGGMRDAKLAAYHYCVFADRLGATGVAGVAELFGNDLIVTLGGWFFGTWPPTAGQIQYKWQVAAGVLMHELGHNLGVHHGGVGDWTNFKPNYHSVLNYTWTTPRSPLFPPNPNLAQQAYAASWQLDYSSTLFPSLDESALSETATSMCGGCAAPHAGHVVPIGPAGALGWGGLVTESATGIDFDNNGVIAGIVAADINFPFAGACSPPRCDENPPGCTRIDGAAPCTLPLSGADDWSNLTLMGSGGQYANGVHGAATPQGVEPSMEGARLLAQSGGCEMNDSFDEYEGGAVDLHGRGGWKGWDNDPALGAASSAAFQRSGGYALEISGAADLAHELCARHSTSSSLAMSVSAWQYIPADFSSQGGGQFAGSYFVLLNTYQDGAHNNADWSAQLQFDSNDGLLKVFHGDGIDRVSVPYETDRWVKIQVLVDLESDWTQVYYDDNLITEYPWTGGVLGDGGGALDVGAVDLYANGSTAIYYEDLVFEHACGSLGGDEDGDTLDARTELLLGTSSCQADSDGDGLLDHEELFFFATDPTRGDTDGDGLRDGDEPTLGYDPLDPDTLPDGVLDGEEDLDGDLLSNAHEISIYESAPLNPDSDADGLLDGEEANLGTDPLRADTDDDGLPDSVDNCPTLPNPQQEDTDGDGAGDACDPIIPCFGDLDGDDVVGLSDLSIQLAHFGTLAGATPDDGDLDGDEDVDLTDLSLLLAVFGSACG